MKLNEFVRTLTCEEQNKLVDCCCCCCLSLVFECYLKNLLRNTPLGREREREILNWVRKNGDYDFNI